MKVQSRTTVYTDGERVASWFLWCPGCETLHRINEDDGGSHSEPVWHIIDRSEEGFTVSPSILVTWTVTQTGQQLEQRCHSFVRNGQWEFLSDCTHHLRGTSGVPLVDLPDWFLTRQRPYDNRGDGQSDESDE